MTDSTSDIKNYLQSINVSTINAISLHMANLETEFSNYVYEIAQRDKEVESKFDIYVDQPALGKRDVLLVTVIDELNQSIENLEDKLTYEHIIMDRKIRAKLKFKDILDQSVNSIHILAELKEQAKKELLVRSISILGDSGSNYPISDAMLNRFIDLCTQLPPLDPK